jgi:hypothetical protein
VGQVSAIPERNLFVSSTSADFCFPSFPFLHAVFASLSSSCSYAHTSKLSGTGGTIAGVGRFLKSMEEDVLICLADCEGSGLYNKV